VVRGRAGRVGEHLLPQLHFLPGGEPDTGKEVLSGSVYPRFGDEATPLERIWVVAQKVNHVVEDFWWEALIRHRGFRPGDSMSTLTLDVHDT